jgi:hypothetical protein
LHQIDRTLIHAKTLILLSLFAEELEEPVRVQRKNAAEGEAYEVVELDGRLGHVPMDSPTGPFVAVGSGLIEKEGRISSKLQSILKSSEFKTFFGEFKKLCGPQGVKFVKQRGSMLDRLYGFGEFVLVMRALKLRLVAICGSESKFDKVMSLVEVIYSIVIRLRDASSGLLEGDVKVLFIHMRSLWLSLSVSCGVSSIPISVHLFSHFREQIKEFGNPTLYCVELSEKHHKLMKSSLLFHSNNQTTKLKYLESFLKRESRQVAYELAGTEIPTVPAATQVPSFSLVQEIFLLPPEKAKQFVLVAKTLLSKFSIDRVFDFSVFGGGWDSSDYSCHIVNERDEMVKHPTRIRCFQLAPSLGIMKLICLSPLDSPDNLWAHCDSPLCSACCSLEYGRSLKCNNFAATEDSLMLPVAFRLSTQETVECLAIPISLTTATRGFGSVGKVQSFKIDVDFEVQLVDMARFRGTCNFCRAKKKGSNIFTGDSFFVERFVNKN